MNGCIDEFECNTRICMLHSIWCIYVYFHIWKNFRAYYYRILRYSYILHQRVSKTTNFILPRNTTPEQPLAIIFTHHHTHHKLAQQLLNLIHLHHLWCIVPHQHSRQRSFKHHEQHNKNNTEQNNLHHSLSINTQ